MLPETRPTGGGLAKLDADLPQAASPGDLL